ncbi:HAD-IIB family hydrolase [Oceaniglobus indicus]|uniref:HAD-IIB family hydrolase n=1 Tax=Oceaniglobus indicus TaxID=2047749 RepID=UPI001F4EA90B|nr:HAD-IIB family hydrolase [Oceaniglobus indicus]
MHIALGGCLTATPVRYGLTEDTGGHIAYVLGASGAQARRSDVTAVDIVTRGFDAPEFGMEGLQHAERLCPKRRILRLFCDNRAYLEKAALEAELPQLEAAFLDLLDKEPRPDVIHAHFSDAAQLAQRAHARFGIPWVFSSHSLALQKTGGVAPCRVERERAAVRNVHALIASSRDEAERQLACYDAAAAGRTFHIAPGVDLSDNASSSRARRLVAPWLRDPEKPIVLAVARPVAKKNLDALLRAYAGSPALQAKANLVILAGQRASIGREQSEADRVTTSLFDLVDRHDLWGKIALPRRHDTADVRSLYALAADGGVFVNPARFEPFGLTIVEAVQAGVPVVATRNGGPANILAAVNYGRCVDPDAVEGIAAACLDLIEDPRRAANAARARTRARALFSWDTWAGEVQNVYCGLFEGRRKRPAPAGLLVSDMDGTLTGDNGAAARLSQWLDRTPAIPLVVATGRSISETRRVLRRWRLAEPRCIIASVGSEVWWRGAQGAYRPDETYAACISADWHPDRIRAIAHGLGMDLQPAHEQRRWKVSFHGDADVARRLEEALHGVGLRCTVIPSHGRFIDVLPVRAGKAAAAAHVAAKLGLGAAQCLAAGDSGNDRDLLTWAGRAVVPANALPELSDLRGAHVRRSKQRHAAGILDALDDWWPQTEGIGAIAAE